MTNKLQNIFETNENLSLSKFAEAIDVNYQAVLKAIRKPIPNVVYDPTYINWDALAELITRREIDIEAIAWADYNNASQRAGSKQLTHTDFAPNESFTLRNDKTDTTYQIVYTTDTHVVILPSTSTTPKVMSFATFAHQGPKKIEATAE